MLIFSIRRIEQTLFYLITIKVKKKSVFIDNDVSMLEIKKFREERSFHCPNERFKVNVAQCVNCSEQGRWNVRIGGPAND